MTKQLINSLSNFMEVADPEYQQGTYESLNKAFPHLNNLYERLLDESHVSDFEKLAMDVIEEQKQNKLHSILDQIEKHKKDILESTNKTSTIESQSQMIRLLQQYILIDSDIHQ